MTSKNCTKCKELKPLSEFHRVYRAYDGRTSSCAKCNNRKAAEYAKTKHGVLKVIYHSQHYNSKSRGHESPKYSMDEFLTWALSQGKFHDLYRNWVNSGYDRWEKPSADRLNDDISYTFDNLQLVTWRENSDKARQDCKNGKKTQKNQRRVKQFDINGKFIDEFYSIKHAARTLKIDNGDIGKCCKGMVNHVGGFLWKFA